MKKNLFALLLLAGFAASCDICQFNVHTDAAPDPDPADRISFSLNQPEAFGVVFPGTRATAATALTSFKAAATTGAAGSETTAWNNVTFTGDGAETPTYTGGKYWPYTDPGYHFYAVSVAEGADSAPALAFAAGGTTVTTDGTKDVVCAYLPYADGSYKVKNHLNFAHIYARLSTVTVNASASYAISNVTVSLVNAKTGGTYNLRTGSSRTDGTGWSALTPAAAGDTPLYTYAGPIAAGSQHTGADNDLYVVPGTYSLKATWTASWDDYTQTFTDVVSTGTIDLVGGSVNAVACTLTGNATELTFSVSLSPWGSNSIAGVTFPVL